jgi:DNA-3-methyladenine glycosylase II
MRARVLTTALLRKAERHFIESDPVMGRLVDTHGRCPLAGSADADYFGALARSIIGQQLSAKAAETIRQRVNAAIPSFDAQGIAAADESSLRAAGLSRSKVRYLHELATGVLVGEPDLDELPHLPDEEVISILTSVNGIGRWTAEMFLVFALRRPDVLSLGDAGLRRSARLLYGAELEDVSELWRPFRSVGSWYLWKHLDG